ncbi:MAG TPA: hypothetical protein VMV83_08830 [Rectinemataceae bacterium]|nr:hypothetical protein [Rectinemataceae bacterium]
MAKPNYQFEKRARELAKKQKKADKLKRREELHEKAGEAAPTDGVDGAPAADEGAPVADDGATGEEAKT